MKIRTDFVTNSSSSSYVYTVGIITKTGDEFTESIYLMDDDDPDTSNYGKPVKVNTDDIIEAATMETIDEMVDRLCGSMFFEDDYEGNEAVFYDIYDLDRDEINIADIDELFLSMKVESFGESEFPLKDFPDDKIQSLFSKVKSDGYDIKLMADALLETPPYRNMAKEKVIEKINLALQEDNVYSLTPLVQIEEETVKIKLDDKKMSVLKKYTWDFYNNELVQGNEYVLENIKDVALLGFENDDHANKHFSGQAIDSVPAEDKLTDIVAKVDISSDDEMRRQNRNISEGSIDIERLYHDFSLEKQKNEIDLVGTMFEGRNKNHENMKTGDPVILKRTPDNPFDSNAIEVFDVAGNSLGHIPKYISELLAEPIDAGKLAVKTANVNIAIPCSQIGPNAKKALMTVIIETLRIDNQSEHIQKHLKQNATYILTTDNTGIKRYVRMKDKVENTDQVQKEKVNYVSELNINEKRNFVMQTDIWENQTFFDIEWLERETFTGFGRVFKDGKIVFEGEIKDGELKGQGKYYLNGELYSEGEFEGSFLNGKGRKYTDGQISEEGEFEDDELKGYGRIYLDGQVYQEGEIKDWELNGQGKKYHDGQISEEGEFKDGKLNGKGKIYLVGELYQEGEFKDGSLNGEGRTYHNGEIYEEGIFRDDKLINPKKVRL